MPFRSQTLDVGFNAFQVKNTPITPPNRVTTVESIGALFQGDTPTLQRATQESLDTIGAAFRMENDVVNAYEYLTQPTFKADPTFDTAKALKADGLFNDYSDNFVGVDNEAEYNAKKQRIAREQRDRQTLGAAGAGGMIAQMAAGIISPTMLLPFVGELRGLKAVGAGVAMGFVGGAAQEIPLQANQETRELSDSVSSIAMSTVMGGLLGGAVAFSRRTPQQLAEEVVTDVGHDMARGQGPSAIPQSVGAEARNDPVPELVRMSPLPRFVDPIWDRHVAPITNAIGDINLPQAWQDLPLLKGLAGKRLGDLSVPDITKINPAYFNLRSDLAQVRRMTAKLEDAGLQIENAAPGGTVANRVRQYDGPLAQALHEVENLFAQYRFGAQSAGKAGAIARSKVVGLLSTEEHLSGAQFRKEIGKAMRNGDKHAIPEVAQAAQYLRKEIYDPLFEAAKSAGLFKDLPDEVIGDATYINRVYDTDLIRLRQPEFEQIIADHLGQKLTAQFREEAAKLNERVARTAERAEDFARPLDEVKTLREKFEEELKGLDEGRDEELADLEADIADKRATARTFDRGTPERATLNDEARALVEKGGAPLAEVAAQRARIRRRLSNLRQAESNITERQNRKLEKIASAEDNSFNTLQSLVKKGQKLVADFDKLDDEVLDAKLSELKTKFAQTAKRYDANEERIAKEQEDEFFAPQEMKSGVQADHGNEAMDARFSKYTTAYDAIDDIRNNSTDDSYKVIAQRVLPYLEGVKFTVLTAGEMVPNTVARNVRGGANGVWLAYKDAPGAPVLEHIYVTGEGFRKPGAVERVVLHESIHSAANIQLKKGFTDWVKNPTRPKTREGKAYNDLSNLRNKLTAEFNTRRYSAGLSPDPEAINSIQYALSKPEELLTVGLTDKRVQEFLKTVNLPSGNAWSRFTEVIKNLLGVPSGTAMERLLEISDDLFSQEKNLQGAFEQTARNTDSGTLQARQFGDHVRMTDLAQKIDDLDSFSRDDARAGVKAMMDDAIERAQKIVERRAVRTSRLRDQAKALDPEAAGKRIEALKTEGRTREAEFLAQWRERGADKLDPVTGAADFGRYSRELAHDITESIKGSFARLPGMDIILKEKGPELARALDVASEKLVSQDGRSFLIDDAQELMARYVRTLGPDIELQRALGDFAPNKGKNVEFLRIREEAVQRIENDLAMMKEQRNPDSGKKVSRPYTQEQMDKRVAGIQGETDQAVKNLEAMISRIRHTYGLPSDPAGMGARMASLASNLNVLRFMSGVLVSSYADVARPIQKHGLMRVMKDGYVPFVKGLGNGTLLRDNLTSRHLRATGAALDVALHSRSSQLFDIGDYVVKGSRFEKAVEYGSSKIGIVALFDYWTAAMKQISGSVAHARMMDSLAVVAGGEKASAKEIEEATRYLAQGGVSDEYATAIWREAQKPGGSENVNGQWWPNTETWDREVRSAYNSFIYRDVANSIITPGVDAPLFMNASPMARLLFQFKSFGMASTTRIALSGLQQRDMAFATGTMISLALGALSYYTYANIVGGTVLAKMQADIARGDYGTFADEAINRSGVLGFGNDVQALAQGIPGIGEHVSFGNQRASRQGYSNMAETVLGPTFGDLLNTGVSIATGASDPTKATLHQARTLLPLQNHALFRHIYDMIEAAVPLKERRN